MVDRRVEEVAKVLVDYSTAIRSGDRVLIRTDLLAKDLALEVFRQALLKGAHPWIRTDLPGVRYILHKYASESQLKFLPEHDFEEIKRTDVYIFLGAPFNVRDLTGIDPARISLRARALKPITDWRTEKTRWVVFYYPTEAMAQEASMSLQEFEDFVYGASLMDWKQLSNQLQGLKRQVDTVDKVMIKSPDTHLEFSVKGRNSEAAVGDKNIPDGELFTSVVEDSVNGSIRFDVPAVYNAYGNVSEDITMTFKKGRVVEAKAVKNHNFMEKMLATDEGAKRIGEFGIGFNYGITKPVMNTLFDEKIGGSIHLALGRGYKETLSKNESAIHWDLIKDLRRDGEVYFDGRLAMKHGKWLILK